MATDKRRFLVIIKIIALVIWLLYLLVFNGGFRDYLPYYSYSDAYEKTNLKIQGGIALIGGSNLIDGLSAKMIHDNTRKCKNFGISSELGGFKNYCYWLDDRVKANFVVYSPLLIWNENLDNLVRENQLDKVIPAIPIATQLWSVFAFSEVKKFRFDSFGDRIDYHCDSLFETFTLNETDFCNSNPLIVSELLNRVIKLKKITKAKIVFVRVPPIYVENRKLELYRGIMNKRVNALKEAGIIIIGNTIVSSDKSLFCDPFHPSKKGRDYFSRELKVCLQKNNAL